MKTKSPEELKRIIKEKWGGKRNPFDQLIQDCIDNLATDNMDAGVDCMYEIAGKCKVAGYSRHGYIDLCMYIENEIQKKTDSRFATLQIHEALKRGREKRGKIIVH